MSALAGFGGATADASVAMYCGGRMVGVCGQERVTRARGAGFNATGLPDEALDLLLSRAGASRSAVTARAVVGPLPVHPEDAEYVDHHAGHAYAAYLTSGFEAATVVICDDEAPYVSVWSGHGCDIVRRELPWSGVGFAELYSQCAAALGFEHAGREQRMEALARLEPATTAAPFESLFRLEGNRLQLAANWESRIRERVAGSPPPSRASIAAALQQRVCDLLLEFLTRVRRNHPTDTLCVGGSLFRNSAMNSAIKRSGVFARVFVPIDPGNAGLAVGAALHLAGGVRPTIAPFLGPSYACEEIKETLDNCKLTYQWLEESDVVGTVVKALEQGMLVGWFEGGMEWGPRALGARSILASPFAPYVLENLNRFLKGREAWRGYALSALEESVPKAFDGPENSAFMECDYAPKDRDAFRHVLPHKRANLRVQTVGANVPRRFRHLLGAFGDRAGQPILVNTSFNGFREPIVCSPRDAIRVFFGTGLDMLVLESFVVRK